MESKVAVRDCGIEFIDTEHIMYFTLCAFGAKGNRKVTVDYQKIRAFCELFKKEFFAKYPLRSSIGLLTSKIDLMESVNRCTVGDGNDREAVFAYGDYHGNSYKAGKGFDKFEAYYGKRLPSVIWDLLEEAAEALAGQMAS